MKKRKENTIFAVLFSLLVLLIFKDIAALKMAFLKGDYLQQFFPWYSIYADRIKSLQLPLWASQFQCGFPLFAEGQIGALYPLNLFFYLLLPFKAAYNYSFLFHFIISGIFTYLFARKIKSDFWGASIAAVLLCFGSAYAGCFVNLSSLKALAWFPLVLLLFEEYLERDNRGFILMIGLICGMQLLAGAFQVSFYALFFYALYFLYRSYSEKRPFLTIITDLSIILFIAFVISLPQIYATLELSRYSNRAEAGLSFSLWGSFSPLALIGAFLPYLGAIFSRGDIIYIGILGLFLAILAMCFLRQEKPVRALILVLAVSIFFALGKYNPIYVILLKLFKFYAFRAPSRFIYFGVFALSVLSAKGFTYFTNKREKSSDAAHRIFISLLVATIGVFFLLKLIFGLWGSKILAFAKDYAAENIYGAPIHRYSLETYISKTENFYNLILERLSLRDPYNILSLIIVIMAILILYLSMKISLKNKIIKFFYIIFICVELYVFSLFAKGVRPELANFNYIQPKESLILSVLQADKGIFRVLPFGKLSDMPLWLRPNMNAYFGLDSIAFYSPLANRDYFLETEGLGIVDDSVGVVAPQEADLYKKIGLVGELNVKYIISMIKLESKELDFVIEENNLYLYKLKDYQRRISFIDINKDNIGEANIKIEKYGPGDLELSLENKEDGCLAFREKFYLGWQVYVDGKKREIQRYKDIFQSVKVLTGRHRVIFKYEPKYIKPLMLIQMVFFLTVIFIAIFNLSSKRKQ